MKRLHIVLAAAFIAATTPAMAQSDWPNRPVTLIVPFAAGGGVDASARMQAIALGEILGQTIVVENVGAAAGTVGSGRVAKAAPDGYTVLIGNSGTHVFSQSLYKKAPYDSTTDFEPVSIVTGSPRLLVARKDLPVNNLQEFVAYIKANKDKMQYGSAGVGSGTHLPCALFNYTIGADVTHVPYRGEGPALQDVIGGRIDYMCTTMQSGAAQSNQGGVKGIAVMGGAPRRGCSKHCDHEGAGPRGCRCRGVERLPVPEGHTEADSAKAARGDRNDDVEARHGEEAGRRRP